MPRPFAITASSRQIELDVKGRAQVAFTVTNSSDRAIKGWANLHVQGPTSATWFAIEPAGEHQFKPGESHQVTVRVAIPDGTPVGNHSFRLNIISGTKGSEEESTEGPEVSFDVRAPSVLPPPKQAPVFLLLLLLVILLIAAVVGVLIWRGRPTPALNFVGRSIQDAAKWSRESGVSLASDLNGWDVTKDLPTNLHLAIVQQDPPAGQGVSRGKPLKLILWQSARALVNGKFDFDEGHETGASTRSGPDFEVVRITNGLAMLNVQRGARVAVLQGADNRNGLASVNLGGFRNSLFTGIEHLIVLPDDSYVLGGYNMVLDAMGGGGNQLRLVHGRYDRDGRVLAGGSSTRQVGEITLHGTLMSVDGSRRILMAEAADSAPVLRFTNASVEEGLGRGVRVSNNFPPSHASHASRMIAQFDDKLVLAGGGEKFRLLRYLPEGRLDPQFANGGVLDTPLRGTTWGNVEVALGPNGSLIVAGIASPSQGSPNQVNAQLVRYRADGSLEWERTPPFVAPGATAPARLNDSATVKDLTVQADNGILLLASHGSRLSTTKPVTFLWRFRPDGSPDPTFGSNGALALQSPNQTPIDSARYVVGTDGKLIVAMEYAQAETQPMRTNVWALMRFTPNGVPDPAFNANNVLSDTALWKGRFGGLSAMARQSDDKLLLVGSGVPEGAVFNSSSFIVRLNPDGTRDEKFAPLYATKEIVQGQASAAVADAGVVLIGPGDEVQWLSNGGRSALLRVDDIPAAGPSEMRFSYLTWTTQ